MCGRYALIDGKRVLTTFTALNKAKGADQAYRDLPRYNASPMQRMPVFAIRKDELVAEPMQWWLIPHWSKDGKPSFSSFNAKSETLHQSRLFAPYFKGSRCLVPADAFYEWQKVTTTHDVRGKSKTVQEKHPMCLRMKDEAPFAFAGLFSIWKDPEGKEHPTFTIITTEPNELLAPIHNRMPVILPEQHFERWLDREYNDTDHLKTLLVPYPARKMNAYRVSSLVSNPRNDEPQCLKPVKE
ncbi:MAG: SOS response-associated peptidase [Ignavibacteria bacterium]|nr:SOS response-associated peptidase [Ignavibacteria bacterium]